MIYRRHFNSILVAGIRGWGWGVWGGTLSLSCGGRAVKGDFARVADRKMTRNEDYNYPAHN